MYWQAKRQPKPEEKTKYPQRRFLACQQEKNLFRAMSK